MIELLEQDLNDALSESIAKELLKENGCNNPDLCKKVIESCVKHGNPWNALMLYSIVEAANESKN